MSLEQLCGLFSDENPEWDVRACDEYVMVAQREAPGRVVSITVGRCLRGLEATVDVLVLGPDGLPVEEVPTSMHSTWTQRGDDGHELWLAAVVVVAEALLSPLAPLAS